MSASVERQCLRQEIESQTFAERALDEAKRAAHHAETKWSDAAGKVGALERAIEEAEQDAPGSTDAFIASLAGGLDVITESPVDELRKQLDEAEVEIAVWRAARKSAEEAIEARLIALDMSKHRVADAARRVAAAEIDVTPMLARAETARQAVLSESATLIAVAHMLPHASLGRQAIESFLQQPWCSPNSIERAPGGERHREWFSALCGDADAKMS
ncbi:hypothetical protein IYX23_02920 [Methylocystis sp. L43]|uniref:hypothetical protein n=1 Tax=unclassified Methylocystis TaxID=2625913 RepID=UPI0018C21B99|nr:MULTISPECIES: hypothetical protein [unclassified Methylocystis]MBG0796649.1 hypothetical protein [Methylocystis sp. L43]MBG0804632.1 hypothetical protein [Methylocystis sp. H15]